MQTSRRRPRSSESSRWIWPSLLIPVVLAVAGLQWYQAQSSAQAGIPLDQAIQYANDEATRDSRQGDGETGSGGAPDAQDPPTGGSIFRRPATLQSAPIQTAQPLTKEAPLAAPRQIGGDRLPDAAVSRQLSSQGADHPLCKSLQTQREAAEEQLKKASSAAEQRTLRNERDTAIQNLNSLGCFR